MTIQQIIDDKSIKRLEKRKALIEGIINGSFDFSAISAACSFCPKKTFPLYWKPWKKSAVPKSSPWKKII